LGRTEDKRAGIDGQGKGSRPESGTPAARRGGSPAGRIAHRFERRRAEGKPAFGAFLTAGDPSLERTVEAALDLDRAGVDVLELGVPFSDPLADGPVIQRASERALARGVTLSEVLRTVERISTRSELPLLLFSYYNPLLQYGLEPLARDAKTAGVDGVLVTDLPPEEAGEWIAAARAVDLDTVFLASPTSPPERLVRVAEASRGFVYAISRTGVTGERQSLSEDARPLVERLRALTRVPVALGFGLSTPEQVREAAAVADGVVVGSALVRFLEEHPEGDLGALVTWLTSTT
jgi:tryptophan synthase alpha chain